MLKLRKELGAGKSKINVSISMTFRGDKKEYHGLESRVKRVSAYD